MISKENQANYRSDLFKHLDGIVTSPTIICLNDHNVLSHLNEFENEYHDVDDLAKRFKANAGYLNVGLRVLASQGWLTANVDNDANKVGYKISIKGKTAFNFISIYKPSVELLKLSAKFHNRRFEVEPFLKLEYVYKEYKKSKEALDKANDSEKLIIEEILKHIEGIILGPTIVHLGMSGMFHKYFMETSFKPEEFHHDADSFERLLDILVDFGLFSKKERVYQFTEKGLFFARRASAYGVTVSYIPTLRNLDELIFGSVHKVKDSDTGTEVHVDRAMNVWGSGGAHANYFKVIDKIIIDLFNKPIDEQPKGILDMGCGNGAFLKHLYYLIEQHTLRGRMLDEYPLTLVGVDYNEEALKITKSNLIQAEIWAKVIWGDIGDPDQLADDLKNNYQIDLGELLNVRTFLDHNRVWNKPQEITIKKSTSTGAYSYMGERLSNIEVEQSLVDHLKKWEPYFRKFGLLVIELHTLEPELTSKNIGKTAATAYDATHGYSDQFIVETSVYENAIKAAGLSFDQETFKKFPDSDMATVTIKLLKSS